MSFAGSSPRWREVEARLRPPPVQPTFQVIHSPKKRDKRAICEQNCCKRVNFLEIKVRRIGILKRRLAAALPPPPIRFTAREIIRSVADRHGLGAEDVLSADRRRSIVLVRHEAYYEIARLLPSYSLVKIAKCCGGRDHTTILLGIRRHMARSGAPSIRGILPTKKKERISRGPVRAPSPRKWTPDKVDLVFRMQDRGMSMSEIGSELGISKTAVWYVIARHSTPTD